LFKELRFELTVKLKQGQRSRISSMQCRVMEAPKAAAVMCCLGTEFQSTGAWWVKDLSVILRRERIEGRCRGTCSTVRLNIEHCGDTKVVLRIVIMMKQLYIGCAAQF